MDERQQRVAMTSVGLWTLRVALTARGRKLLGAGIAAVEAVVFAIAFTSLAANLDSPVLLCSYATGVAGGTLLGWWLTSDSRWGRRSTPPPRSGRSTSRTCRVSGRR